MWAINLLTILCLSTRTRTEMMLSGDTLINASQQQQHRLQDVNHGSWHTFDNDAGCSSFNRFNCPGSRPSVWTLSSYDVDNTWHLLLWPLERSLGFAELLSLSIETSLFQCGSPKHRLILPRNWVSALPVLDGEILQRPRRKEPLKDYPRAG